MSTISRYPATRLVYSSFGFYGRRRGGELPGLWFTEALEHVGVTTATTRKTLLRMEGAGELRTRKVGRHKVYRPSEYAWAAIDAGAERIMAPPERAWSGEWTLVHTRFDGDRRLDRDQVRTLLHSEGFAPLGPGVYIHPRVRAARLLAALGKQGLSRFATVIRGRIEGRDPGELAAECWDLETLAGGYRAWLGRYGPLLDAAGPAGPSGAAAFALKFAVVLDFLEVAWRDPDLPPRLLPEGWPGHEAREGARALNARLLPPAVAFGDSVLERVLERSPDLTLPRFDATAAIPSGSPP